MDKKENKRNKLYTPELHILVGEVITTETGEPALRIKKQGCSKYEVITLSSLVSCISQKAFTIA